MVGRRHYSRFDTNNSVFDVKFLWGLPFGLLYFYYLRSGIAFAHYQELVGYRNL